VLGKGHECGNVVSLYWHTFSEILNSAVSGRAPDFFDFGRLPQTPDQGVLASPASDHQNFHSRLTIVAASLTVNTTTSEKG
jgi:hypothetical protein